jgi:hypothetical protein
MKYWRVINALREFDLGIRPELCVIVGGGWWGVYASDAADKIEVMDKLVESGTAGVFPIDEAGYLDLLSRGKKKPDPSIKPLPTLNASQPKAAVKGNGAEVVEGTDRDGGPSDPVPEEPLTLEKAVTIQPVEKSRRISKKSKK